MSRDMSIVFEYMIKVIFSIFGLDCSEHRLSKSSQWHYKIFTKYILFVTFFALTFISAFGMSGNDGMPGNDKTSKVLTQTSVNTKLQDATQNPSSCTLHCAQSNADLNNNNAHAQDTLSENFLLELSSLPLDLVNVEKFIGNIGNNIIIKKDENGKIANKAEIDSQKQKMFNHILHAFAPRFLPSFFSKGKQTEYLNQILAREQMLDINVEKEHVQKLLCRAVRNRSEYLTAISSLTTISLEKLSIAAFELALDHPDIYGYLASDLFTISSCTIEAIVKAVSYRFKDVVVLDKYMKDMIGFESLLDGCKNDFNKDHEVFKNTMKLHLLNCMKQIRCFLSLFSGEEMSVSADVFAIQKAISSGKERAQEQKVLSAHDLINYISDSILETLTPDAEFAIIISVVTHPNFMRSFIEEIKKIEREFAECKYLDLENRNILNNIDVLTEHDENNKNRLSTLIQKALDKYAFTPEQKKSIKESVIKLSENKPGQRIVS